MRINKSKEECCGCSACECICPHQAITMKADPLGFLYPEIDNELCVDCGLCEKVCSFKSDYSVKFNLQSAIPYAVRHKNMTEIKLSQSGAAFIAFSDWILERGGVIYGVGFGEHYKVMHKRATTLRERDEFRGSKYVQSDLTSIFKQIKEDLKQGFIVLFTGTPCQTAGLASFIGYKLRKNLYLIDLICHGVSAPKVWSEYISYLEKKEKKTITSVRFRDKSQHGWQSHVESFEFASSFTRTYAYKFYTHINLRYSCYFCPFANVKRPSDITIGDFWGIEKTHLKSFADDNNGCSLVLINTEKGKLIFKEINESINFKETTLTDCLQPNLQYPTVLHPKRDVFEKDFKRKGFFYTMKKYGRVGRLQKCKQLLVKIYARMQKITSNLL